MGVRNGYLTFCTLTPVMKDDDDGDRLSCVGGWCEYDLGTNNDVTVMIINDYIIIIKYVNVIMYLYMQTHTHTPTYIWRRWITPQSKRRSLTQNLIRQCRIGQFAVQIKTMVIIQLYSCKSQLKLFGGVNGNILLTLWTEMEC